MQETEDPKECPDTVPSGHVIANILSQWEGSHKAPSLWVVAGEGVSYSSVVYPLVSYHCSNKAQPSMLT